MSAPLSARSAAKHDGRGDRAERAKTIPQHAGPIERRVWVRVWIAVDGQRIPISISVVRGIAIRIAVHRVTAVSVAPRLIFRLRRRLRLRWRLVP
jgi:hypothetical protein